MKAFPFLIATLLAFAACRPAPEAGPAGDSEAQARPDLPDADINASLGELGAAPDFPVGPTQSFAGPSATDNEGCSRRAWQFTAAGLDTPAGSSCRFTRTRRTSQGYEIDAQCTAEGPEQADRITLKFEDDGRMRFQSAVIADAILTSCRQED